MKRNKTALAGLIAVMALAMLAIPYFVGAQDFYQPWVKTQKLYLNGTEVTATAAELNKLDGVTATAAELNKTDGLTADPSEINVVDGVTAGTVTASKAVVVDSSKKVNEWNVTGDVTVDSDSTGGNAGAKSLITGLPNLGLVALAAMTNGTTETTLYLDDSPDGEWAEVDADAHVAVTVDETYYRVGAKSLKVAFAATAVAGDGVDGTIAADDLEANESLGFWIYTDTALTAGDLYVEFDDDTADPDPTVDVPAISATNKWQWVELNISDIDGGGGDADAVNGVKIFLSSEGATNLGAFNVYFDGMYKWDADDEEDLGANIVDHGVLSVMSVETAAGSANTTVALTENTDYFVHYAGTGNDMLVTISNMSARSAFAMIAKE